MAASSEIRFKIGADTAALSKEFSALPEKARSVGDRVRSAFGQLLPRKDAAASFSVFEEAFAKAEQQSLELARTQQENTRKSAAESAAVFEKQLRAADELKDAQDTLVSTKKRHAYDEANTVGKLKITTGELATLARQRNALAANSVERLKVEVQIEEKLATLRRLQRTQGAANAAALLPTPAQVEAKATGLLATIRRKFSGTGLAQGLLQGIGIGSVQSITDMIVAPFEAAAERARALVGVTASLSDNTNRWLSALGGPRRELELQVRQVNDLNTEISLQRQLVADLNANPLRFINAETRTAIKEAEAGLDALILKQAEMATTAQMVALADSRRTGDLQRQAALAKQIADAESKNFAQGLLVQARREAIETEYEILKTRGAMPSVLQENRNALATLNQEEVRAVRLINDQVEGIKRTGLAQREQAALELKDAGERAQALAKLTALRRESDVLVTKNKRFTPEATTNRNEQNAVKAQLALLDKTARREQSGALLGLGQSMTGGRVGRRSETERLADRGAAFMAQADTATRAGASPDYVASLVSKANRDLGKSGSRASNSLSALSQANPELGQLVTIGRTLDEIKKNLAPVKAGTTAAGAKK